MGNDVDERMSKFMNAGMERVLIPGTGVWRFACTDCDVYE